MFRTGVNYRWYEFKQFSGEPSGTLQAVPVQDRMVAFWYLTFDARSVAVVTNQVWKQETHNTVSIRTAIAAPERVQECRRFPSLR